MARSYSLHSATEHNVWHQKVKMQNAVKKQAHFIWYVWLDARYLTYSS
jgi:hypothetical protein